MPLRPFVLLNTSFQDVLACGYACVCIHVSAGVNWLKQAQKENILCDLPELTPSLHLFLSLSLSLSLSAPTTAQSVPPE